MYFKQWPRGLINAKFDIPDKRTMQISIALIKNRMKL